MSDQRILRYQVLLMENSGLTISPCEVLNPANFLLTPEGSLPFHSSLETLDHWTKPQEGLSEDPLTNPGEIWYTDGSSFVLDGKRRAGQGTRTWHLDSLLTSQAVEKNRRGHSIHLSTSYNMQCQFNKDVKLQPTMKNITPVDGHRYKDSEAWD